MKTVTVTDKLTGTKFKMSFDDGATPDEVSAAVELEAARRRHTAQLEADAAEEARQRSIPLPPPPPPWRIAGRDPNDDEVRCTRCGGYKTRRDMGAHLVKCELEKLEG